MTTCQQCGHADPGGFLFCPRCGTKAVEGASGADPLLGRILNGKYRVESQIGVGAMGTVYLGEHIGLRKKVALKVLHSDLEVSDESLQRFQREGMAAGRFNHPHAIQIFDFDRSDTSNGARRIFYLAMEYVEGVNLTLFLRQRGRLSVELALKLMRQMLSCLAEAHRHGIVHRDFKPDNIMVSEASRGEMRVKVLDFGLSKLVDRRMNSSLLTQPGRLLGTPLYMAPEQVAGDEADERSDVYAAGLILYEMLAGERPFKEKDSAQLFITRPSAEAPSIRANVPDLELPDELEALLLRALERDREKRFQSAEEMLNALDEVPLELSGSVNRTANRSTAPARRSAAPAGPSAAPAAPPPPPATDGAGGRRRRVRIAMVFLLALVALRQWGPWSRSGGAAPARVRALAAEDRSETQQKYVGLLDEARLKLHGGDSQGALTAVNQASLLDCRDTEMFLVRAEIYRSRGDLDSALADFDTAAAAEPDSLEPLLGRGWIQVDRGDAAGAFDTFGRASKLDANDAEVLAFFGANQLMKGERDDARLLLQSALQHDQGCARAHLYLGRLLLETGDAPGAITELVTAKSSNPFWVQPLLILSEAYLAQGNADLADAQLGDALRLEPASAELRLKRGALLLDRGRSAEALEFLRESTEKAPQEARLWILRGVAAYEAGEAEAAVDALRRGFEQGARDPEARCLLGTLYQSQQKLPEAIAQFETVLREEGELPAANLSLGLALFAKGEYDEAAKRFDRVLAFDEENAQAHLLLGQLYKNFLGDDPQALAHLERYQQLGGDDPRLADWLDQLR